MPRRSRQGVLKRQRERKKAEKAELKRSERSERPHSETGDGTPIASADDLAGYGVGPEPDAEPGTD